MAQNIEMQCKQSDGSYETLLPKSQASLLEINNTDLGSHLGGNTTVEGSLDYLSRLYAYWWKREGKSYEIIYTPISDLGYSGYLRKSTLKVTSYNDSINDSAEWRVIDSVEFNSVTGKFSETRITDYVATLSYKIKRYFSQNIQDYYYGTDSNSVVNPEQRSCNFVKFNGEYYVFKKESGEQVSSWISLGGELRDYDNPVNIGDILNYGVYYSDDTKVVCYKMSSQLKQSNIDYVYSFSRDTYPDSGMVGNYTYTYLGIPFENAMKDGPK